MGEIDKEQVNIMRYTIENQQIKIEVDSFGAELKSLKKKQSMFGENTEYMWNADPAFWKRTSPVLFPIVGSLKDKKYCYDGKTYEMSQHGFARDMEFTLEAKDATHLTFLLKETQDTIKVYPFSFALRISYVLEENTVKVVWDVTNTNDNTMYFSIGGHPAFYCPIQEQGVQTDYYLDFDHKEQVVSSVIGEGGLTTGEHKEYVLADGKMKITSDLFDQDALVIENNQTGKVSLMTPEQKAYVTLTFDAPLFGVWSPTGKNAPFVCIEPWYGRCDSADFDGLLQDRTWGNELEAGKVFHTTYDICVE